MVTKINKIYITLKYNPAVIPKSIKYIYKVGPAIKGFNISISFIYVIGPGSF